MPHRGVNTPLLARRLSMTCAAACALHLGAAVADDLQYGTVQPGRPVVLAAAPMESPAMSARLSRAALEVQQPPADITPATAISPPAAASLEAASPAAVAAPAVSAAVELQTGSLNNAQANADANAQPAADGVAADSGGATPAPRGGNTGILGLHSAIEFGVFGAARQPVDPANAPFHEQVRRISAGLEVAARDLYPEQSKHIGAFDVYVGNADDLSTMSSGTGKVSINAGFSKLNPTDDWMALVIAREMGHVIAGHHDSNAGASIAVSLLMNIIVPGSGLIKSAISLAGSQIASGSRHDKQTKEADDVAVKLLEAAGYTRKSVALNLRLNPLGEEVSTSWAKDFRKTATQLTAVLPAMPEAAPATAVAAAALPQAAAAESSQTAVLQPVALPQTAARPAVLSQAAVQDAAAGRWQPVETARPRPSGLPGPLYLGGYQVPVR
jgi:hypothetical protein